MGTSNKDSQRKGGPTRAGRAIRSARLPPASSASFRALLKALEDNVIPELVNAKRDQPLAVSGKARASTTEVKASDIAQLANAAMEADPAAIHTQVHRLRTRGLSLETIFLDLLSPAARALGVRWERDEIDFVAVTAALSRIHQVVRELSALIPGRTLRPSGAAAPRILLAATPGEQHNLGVLMVAEFFQRQGWEVLHMPSPSLEQLVRAAEETAFDMIGLSLGGEARLNTLISTLEALRSVSKNPDVGMMVGGALFALQPDIARRVPADAVAHDAASAVHLASALLRKINLRVRASRLTTEVGSPTPSSPH